MIKNIRGILTSPCPSSILDYQQGGVCVYIMGKAVTPKLLSWSSTFGSSFKIFPVELYTGRWVHITFFYSHYNWNWTSSHLGSWLCLVKSKCSKCLSPICTPQAALHFHCFQTPSKNNESCHLSVTRELSGSLNFSPNSSFKTTPMSLPWEQGPHCSAVLQLPKEGAHFFGVFWAQTTHPHRRKDLYALRVSFNAGKGHFWISVNGAHLLRRDSHSHQI